MTYLIITIKVPVHGYDIWEVDLCYGVPLKSEQIALVQIAIKDYKNEHDWFNEQQDIDCLNSFFHKNKVENHTEFTWSQLLKVLNEIAFVKGWELPMTNNSVIDNKTTSSTDKSIKVEQVCQLSSDLKERPSKRDIHPAKSSEKEIKILPAVFSVPDCEIEDNLVAVMMPFNPVFDKVYSAIRTACEQSGFDCLRADDIWETETIMQDIFNLIYRAKIIVVDFSTKNPNVMYETGIAHTLGRTVIPITQNLDDVPSDMNHHRALIYMNNNEGVNKLSTELEKKLKSMKPK